MNVITVTEATFEQDVLKRSADVPVVVDFWAEWCGPCKTLGPLLERLAEEADGAWILAKIDVDANQNISGAFGIQSIPAVKAFKNGRIVSEFVGAQPEQIVRDFVAKLGPTDVERLIAEADEKDDATEALEIYRRALVLEPWNTTASAAIARIELEQRAGSLDKDPLIKRLDADPTDVEAATGLADLFFAEDDVVQGAAVLIAVVRAASGEERETARAHLVRLLETRMPEEPAVIDARRQLATALF